MTAIKGSHQRSVANIVSGINLRVVTKQGFANRKLAECCRYVQRSAVTHRSPVVIHAESGIYFSTSLQQQLADLVLPDSNRPK